MLRVLELDACTVCYDMLGLVRRCRRRSSGPEVRELSVGMISLLVIEEARTGTYRRRRSSLAAPSFSPADHLCRVNTTLMKIEIHYSPAPHAGHERRGYLSGWG